MLKFLKLSDSIITFIKSCLHGKQLALFHGPYVAMNILI